MLIVNAKIINRGKIQEADVLIKHGRIEKIAPQLSAPAGVPTFDADGQYLMPGIIDDQVHFREPGLTHKATIGTESRAAVAGGTTSFMEMPNVNPPSTSQELLEQKYEIGAKTSLANYSFYMGTTNDNYDEVMRTDPKKVCGIKIFMGSSTGNMLVDNPGTLERVFANANLLIATHCEDEQTVMRNNEWYQKVYGSDFSAAYHPKIRNVEACLLSSSMAVAMAKKHGTRLHILHISTKEELDLFTNKIPLEQKKITSEVCVHHMYFHAGQYEKLGNQIKCNPAIKSYHHRNALLPALLDDRLDVIATDHAPHTWDEKMQTYLKAPSGLPLVQNSLHIMLEFFHEGRISLEKIVEKMCHAPAIAYKVKDRGYIDEGYWADMVLVDTQKKWTVAKENILYKCAWSPLEGHTFKGDVRATWVNGHLAWHEGRLNDAILGKRLEFDR